MRKIALGLTVIFLGSIFFTSCSSDNTALSQFSKRKYMKNFKKSKHKQKEVIDEYQYANAAVETEYRTAKIENVVLEEIVAIDDAELVVVTESNTEITTVKNVTVEKDYSSWNTYNRNADMAEAVSYYDAKAEKMGSKLSSNSSSTQVNDIVLIILGIFIPPLAVYLYEDSITSNFWLDLVFTLLFWVPGIIYAFLVMFAGVSI